MIFDGRNSVRYSYSCWGYTRGNGSVWHGGIDIEGLNSDIIKMPSYNGKSISGKVVAARIVTDRSNLTWEWGYYVCVQLDANQTPDAVNYLYFCHCAKLLVHAGQTVKTGDALAVMGDTGNAALSAQAYKHCHFEVRATATSKGLDPTAYAGFPNSVGVFEEKGEDKLYKGIDTSKHNGAITEADIAGLDFVIARVGFGYDLKSQDDAQFAATVALCEKLGKPWGAYLYSYALTVEDAKSEAQHMIRLLDGKKPPMGAWFDMEDADGYKAKNGMPSDKTLVDMCATFCSIVEPVAGYAGIYASLSWLNGKLKSSTLDRYDKWVAQWASKCSYGGSYHIWQNSNSLTINGKRFDSDVSDVCPLQKSEKKYTLQVGPMNAGDAAAIKAKAAELNIACKAV